jgi:Spy/CpxP family protein refolding chaperone
MLAVSSIAAPGRILKAAKALELTDDQIEQIKDAGYKHQKSMIQLKSLLNNRNRAMNKVILKEHC